MFSSELPIDELINCKL